ncbi:lipase [Pyxidicoccus sp. MSG2]|uniref:PGAP1-like alpha/beta domain-containing protein n=1 Tax=Pyxidicoccus sp. MSG2 TaxID=2996790 RepID=UPI002270AC2C|nr:lipase [Pyxidicoccus sp. MSG2]MCY1016654.1 lipase [Pyxidicoccus sp. MSG2]
MTQSLPDVALPPPTPTPAPARESGAIARLSRSLRGLPPAERWWGPGCGGLAGWLQRSAQGLPGEDLTPRFKALLTRVREGEPVLPDAAKRHQYVLVRGMLGDELPGYLLDNVQRLERRGLDVLEAPVDTEGLIRDNVAVLREALLDAEHFGRSVVLVGHSKGGVECTATLALHPELRRVVRAVVTLQAPYGGSSLAHDLATTPEMRRLIDFAFPLLFHGVSRSVEELSYTSRMAFIRKHPYPAGIPTVSLATSRLSRLSSLYPLQRYLRDRYGYASDGLVTALDAEVPGAGVVRLDDMDHAEGALRALPGFNRYHPGDVTEAMVALALDAR